MGVQSSQTWIRRLKKTLHVTGRMDSREFKNVGIFSDQSRETPDFLKILALLMTNILYCSSHEFFIFWLFYLLKALQNVDRFQRIQQER